MSSETASLIVTQIQTKKTSREGNNLLVPIEPTKAKQVNKEGTFTTSPNVLILSGHQPNLLTYLGFFFRMYHSNIMDICSYDPFCKHSDRYQCRVKIGRDNNWEWLTLPVDASSGCSIMDAKLKAHLMSDRWATLERVYSKYPLWPDYKSDLHTIFFGYEYLWALNLRFIFWIRDLLKIKLTYRFPTREMGRTRLKGLLLNLQIMDPWFILQEKDLLNI